MVGCQHPTTFGLVLSAADPPASPLLIRQGPTSPTRSAGRGAVTMLPEALLIEQARARSLPAWSEIYARHFDQIYKYVYFRVRDPEAA